MTMPTLRVRLATTVSRLRIDAGCGSRGQCSGAPLKDGHGQSRPVCETFGNSPEFRLEQGVGRLAHGEKGPTAASIHPC
jgi:hypothetical protein